MASAHILELKASTPRVVNYSFGASLSLPLFYSTAHHALTLWLTKRFKTTDDESRNSFILTLITLGEGWHNNHHRYQATTKQGFYWWEFDPTYYLLKMLSWTGLIWGLKGVPESVYEEAEKTKAESQQRA